MVHCVNEECGREIGSNWSFCPFCGQDQRREDNRTAVQLCDHKFVTGGDYCIGCGGRYNDQYFEVPPFARKLGWSTAAVGAAIVVIAFLIWVIHATHGPGFDAISSWYDKGPVLRVASGNNLKATQGPGITWGLFAIGLVIVIAGLTAARTKRPRYYTGETIKYP